MQCNECIVLNAMQWIHCFEYNGLNAMWWIQFGECNLMNAMWLIDEYNLLIKCKYYNVMNSM